MQNADAPLSTLENNFFFQEKPNVVCFFFKTYNRHGFIPENSYTSSRSLETLNFSSKSLIIHPHSAKNYPSKLVEFGDFTYTPF